MLEKGIHELFRIIMIKVTYSDDSVEQYETLEEAREGILETVVGCDFAVTVDTVKQDGKELIMIWDFEFRSL